MKTLAPLAAAAALLTFQPALASSPQVCDQTTRNLFSACRNEIWDDRLTAYATCANLIDEDAQAECYAEANADFQEASELCKEQRSARFEVCGDLGQAAYDLTGYWQPENFVDPDAIGGAVPPNPWFDLTPGTVNTFTGGGELIEVTVTGDTKLIEGVTCRTVRDLVTEDGLAIEDTDDWYAQDIHGAVWYCGEQVKNYEFYEGDDPEAPELVDIEGSWKAFRDGAQPGILFRMDPILGEVYRQEAAWGDAEDVARVESVTANGLVDGDECEDGDATGLLDDYLEETCDDSCLVTLEYSPIEPDVYAHKYYAAGRGLLAEVEDGVCTVIAGVLPEDGEGGDEGED